METEENRRGKTRDLQENWKYQRKMSPKDGHNREKWYRPNINIPASGSFPMSQFFASGGQSTGASASVLPMNIQD